MAKILIFSPSLIGQFMAGPAIRSWEFAKALSVNHQVILISLGTPGIKSEAFEILSLHDPKCNKHFQDADILIAQRLTFPFALKSKLNGIKIIIDAYVPDPLELLEHYKMEFDKERKGKIFSEISNLILKFKIADGILCASEKQRELWIGFLLGQKLITPERYENDPNLRDYLAVVPFGIPSQLPQKKGKGFRDKFGWDSNDKVLIWGGGIWNWFDPLSLIKAMKLIKDKRDIKLIFMAVKPSDYIQPMTSMSEQSIQMAKDLDVIDRTVFFNREWIPYNEREDYLLDATIGVSTHFDHLETQFSFRTRLLDYIWAGLPILTSDGDSFADLVKKSHIGEVAPCRDPEGIAKAICSMATDSNNYLRYKKNIDAIREQFYWATALRPLETMIDRLITAPPKSKNWQDGITMFQLALIKLKERGFKACLNSCFKLYS